MNTIHIGVNVLSSSTTIDATAFQNTKIYVQHEDHPHMHWSQSASIDATASKGVITDEAHEDHPAWSQDEEYVPPPQVPSRGGRAEERRGA